MLALTMLLRDAGHEVRGDLGMPHFTGDPAALIRLLGSLSDRAEG